MIIAGLRARLPEPVEGLRNKPRARHDDSSILKTTKSRHAEALEAEGSISKE